MDTQIKLNFNLSFDPAPPPLTPTRYTGWRLLYTGEGGNDNPLNMPAVAPSFDAQPIPFTETLQLLSWQLMQRLNPTITSMQWRSVYRYDRAFTNFNGFDDPNNACADYVNRLDLGAPLPKLMKAIICSGSLYDGIVEGDKLVMYPGVHAMDAATPVSVDELIRRRWYFLATSWTGKGGVHFPQGNGDVVPIPYIIRARTEYPLAWFQRWDREYLPDPLKIYG
jgi:hypothetical protein